MTQRIVIFGSAEIAELAHFYFTHDSGYEVVAFTVDDAYVNEDSLLGLPIVPWSKLKDLYPPQDYKAHVALSYKGLNRLRQVKYEQCKSAGYELVNYISSKAVVWPGLNIGDNCFFLEQQNIQPNVEIGNNVLLWSSNHIGHGSKIGSHCYFASHIVVSGHVTIGERCFIGVNASFKDFISVGNDNFIAMSSIVTKDLPDHTIVLPAQSTILLQTDEKNRKIIEKTFGKYENE